VCIEAEGGVVTPPPPVLPQIPKSRIWGRGKQSAYEFWNFYSASDNVSKDIEGVILAGMDALID